MKNTALLTFLAAVFTTSTFAHPGHDVAEEAAERADFIKRNPRSVQSCGKELARRGHTVDALNRRRELADRVLKKRGEDFSTLQRRQSDNLTHQSSKDVGLGSDETLLFADNSSCLLQPEVTQGPYYVDGELIRHNIVEDQVGVPLYLDIQIVDTSTCEPIPALFADIWHCNATGVYSGVVADGNGNSGDASNIDETFLRGIQQTDLNGVMQFETIFPGHYTGRTIHIHVLTYNQENIIVRTNQTLLDDSGNATAHASHVGQIFFDQGLISLVEAVEPYTSNTQVLTLNDEDNILAQEAAVGDPYVEWVQLGSDISDGILAWISIGIDPTLDTEIAAAATIYEDGGVASNNSFNFRPGGALISPSGSGAPASSSTAAA